jgi:hypothetical protein
MMVIRRGGLGGKQGGKWHAWDIYLVNVLE